MLTYSASTPVSASAAALFDWHERPGAFQRLSPPWQDVSLERHDGIRDGDRAVIRLGAGPVAIRWVAEHRAYADACRRGEGACQFEDVQVSGPFASWHHTHRMLPNGPSDSVLLDEVDYQLPLAPLSTAVGGWAARAQLDRMFAYRHRVTREDVRRHAEADAPPMTVAITGATGLVGSALAAFLTGGGHTVVRLVRTPGTVARWDRGPQERAVYWNVAQGEVEMPALRRHAPDAVVHLAGEPVYGLAYTAAKKRRIWESRTQGTQLLARALAALDRPPRVLVSASASGVYGDRDATPVTEADAPGTGFLADVCQAWEASTAEAEAAGIRTVHARIGLVATPAGGMLGTLAPVARLGLGGWVGDGSAYWPWITLDDAIYALAFLIRNETLAGPVNVSAPEPVPSRTFVETLGAVLRRPAVLRAPEAVVRALGGEIADELALKSVRMRPARLEAAGFRFAYPGLAQGLGHVLGHLDASP
ncbi:MAG: TIGR01777 family oxidoreductase [Bacteroidota bacterium]